tara:strand:+ start:361 stop:1131 length:771 start_codon:yes stop_codon:yes gene_type:complete
MKVVILAGGFGTRLSEETELKPKPMVEIGGYPMLWHIMKLYSSFGLNEFIILLGYKGYLIKEYFSNYFLHQSDITIDIADNKLDIHTKRVDPWKITLLETGLNTMTGGRITYIKDYIDNDSFLLTYGDGLSNVRIDKTIDFHKENKKLITMTAVMPEGRYGALKINDQSLITDFEEKPAGDGSWINGGFFVCEPKVLDYIDNDQTIFEQEPLNQLAKEKQLVAWKHDGFWQCMDTMRDKHRLTELWESGKAPWRTW